MSKICILSASWRIELDLSLEIWILTLIMCLTIPKKVKSINQDNSVIVENLNGGRQKVGSIIKVRVGDNVLTQNNIIIQKISKKQAKELANLFKK